MKYIFWSILLAASLSANLVQAQHIISGRIIDKSSEAPVEGVTIRPGGDCNCPAGVCGAVSDRNGCFTIDAGIADSLYFSVLNFATKAQVIDSSFLLVSMQPASNLLHQVVVTGSRFAQDRHDVPSAISVVTQKIINDTKATQLDQLVNKVPGVFMVDLGNEQHEMSIRQPMTTQSLFLYMEDGIPIRTSGLYNHNALLEMNMAAMDRMEVLKGPASAQYGAEAVGGAVNVITALPPAAPAGKITIERDNNGYKRADIQAGNTFDKFGVVLSGYYAERKDGPIDYSDFHKTALTLNTVYTFNADLKWTNNATYVDYYSDMTGSLDSQKFAHKDFSTNYTFTYRKVRALRIKSQLEKQWGEHAASQFALMYRDNNTGQNPAYRIKDNKIDPLKASGEINDNAFRSFVALLQHHQKFRWLQSNIIAGLSADISPSNYVASFIDIQRSDDGRYISYTDRDSLLAKYSTGIHNYAVFVQYQFSPVKHLKVTAAGRYDLFDYNFRNALQSSAVSGAPSSNVHFGRFTPKAGITYNLGQIGFYGNFAQGFVPPQVTELFNNVKVPFLKPQVFDNYEVGGWAALLRNKLYADWSLYRLDGTNEIISIRNDDGSSESKNAGKTRHTGIEYGLNYLPDEEWSLRVSGTNAKHSFIQETENGTDISGNEMSTAPHFILNTELAFHPKFLKGFRISMEWQKMGNYFMDDANTVTYNGFSVFNIRAGYALKHFSFWINALNVFDTYYADIASKSAYGYSYNTGNPFSLMTGLSYRFGK